jgi:hypothetical protein
MTGTRSNLPPTCTASRNGVGRGPAG